MSNLDQIFGLEEDDILVATSPLLLAGCVIIAIVIGWLCAKKYENTSDFMKSVKLYVPLAAVNFVVFLLLGVPWIFALGGQLCGFAVMAWISNYYFYH